MKKYFIYKKWNFLIFLNNLISSSFFMYSKKIIFLRFDIKKSFFWVYSKKIKRVSKKIISFKKRFREH